MCGDEFSLRYSDLVTGSYDCVDRIVLNAFFPLGHNPGGFRTWWRRWHHDSDAELDKLARYAPGAAVMIRLAVSPAASDVPSEGKFGVDPDEAVRLLLAAADLQDHLMVASNDLERLHRLLDDASGALIGMIETSRREGQNINFAIEARQLAGVGLGLQLASSCVRLIRV